MSQTGGTLTLRDELSAYCERHDVTHYAVANDIGIKQPYIYQIKSGNERRVPMRVCLRVAAHIGLDWDFELLYTEDDEYAVPELHIVYKQRGSNE